MSLARVSALLASLSGLPPEAVFTDAGVELLRRADTTEVFSLASARGRFELQRDGGLRRLPEPPTTLYRFPLLGVGKPLSAAATAALAQFVLASVYTRPPPQTVKLCGGFDPGIAFRFRATADDAGVAGSVTVLWCFGCDQAGVVIPGASSPVVFDAPVRRGTAYARAALPGRAFLPFPSTAPDDWSLAEPPLPIELYARMVAAADGGRVSDAREPAPFAIDAPPEQVARAVLVGLGDGDGALRPEEVVLAHALDGVALATVEAEFERSGHTERTGIGAARLLALTALATRLAEPDRTRWAAKLIERAISQTKPEVRGPVVLLAVDAPDEQVTTTLRQVLTRDLLAWSPQATTETPSSRAEAKLALAMRGACAHALQAGAAPPTDPVDSDALELTQAWCRAARAGTAARLVRSPVPLLRASAARLLRARRDVEAIGVFVDEARELPASYQRDAAWLVRRLASDVGREADVGASFADAARWWREHHHEVAAGWARADAGLGR